MKKIFLSAIIALSSIAAFAQGDKKEGPKAEEKKPVIEAKDSLGKVEIKADAPAVDLAKAAVKAHGGDKFKNMQSLMFSGSADFSVEGSPQGLTAGFLQAFAGEKYRIELNNPVAPFKQMSDGEQTYSAGGRGITLPPLNRVGLALLQRYDEKGFSISALADDKKKKKAGFRITSPEGYFTDFFIDEKSGQIKSYESSYEVNGATATTSVEIDKIREVEGVMIPEKFSQRLQFGTFIVYAAFKAKEILVNTKLPEDTFLIPKN